VKAGEVELRAVQRSSERRSNPMSRIDTAK